MKICPGCRTYNQVDYHVCVQCGADLPKHTGGTYGKGVRELGKGAGQGIVRAVRHVLALALGVALLALSIIGLGAAGVEQETAVVIASAAFLAVGIFWRVYVVVRKEE